jgi:outer membrane protein assembly factor BamB
MKLAYRCLTTFTMTWTMACAWIASAETSADAPEMEDRVAEARAMNARPHAAPPAQFRSGTASPKLLAASSVTRTATGFEIALPSGAPVPSPAVHEGILVTGGGFHSREIHAFDAKTGKPLWGLELSDDGPSTPACAKGVCVWNTESCTVFAVEVLTGKLLWTHYLGDPQLSAPAIDGDTVFTVYPASLGAQQPPGASHVLAAFALRTGATRWQRFIDADAISAPVAAEGEVHLSSMAGTLYRLRQSDGEILSARSARATSAPTVAKGEIFYSKRAENEGGSRPEESLAKRRKDSAARPVEVARKAAPYLDASVQRATALASEGKALDAANGFGGGAPAAAKAEIAEVNLGQASVSTLQAFQGSRVLRLGDRTIATMGDEVVATDSATGRALWKRALRGDLAASGGFLATPPAAAGGKLVVGTLYGEVQILEPVSGALVRTLAVGAPVRSQPVVHDGWIYVGTENGRLVALATGDAALGGWPQWGGDATRRGAVE